MPRRVLLIGRNELDPYLYDPPDSLRFYRTTAPFTDLYCVLGQFNEQLFHLRHTQNFGKGHECGSGPEQVPLTRFLPERTQGRPTWTSPPWWQSPEQRYRVYGAFLWSKIQNEEQRVAGRITYTTYLGPPELAETFLDNALTDRGYLHGRITQTYDFGETTYTYDTLVTDSVVGKSLCRNSASTTRPDSSTSAMTFYDASTDRSFYGDGISNRGYFESHQRCGWLVQQTRPDVGKQSGLFKHVVLLEGRPALCRCWSGPDTTGNYDKSIAAGEGTGGDDLGEWKRPSISLNAQKISCLMHITPDLVLQLEGTCCRFHGEIFLGWEIIPGCSVSTPIFSPTWDATQNIFSRDFLQASNQKTYDLMLRFKTVAIEDYRYLLIISGSRRGSLVSGPRRTNLWCI